MPLNPEDTVTINVHKNKHIYVVRYYDEEERKRKGITHHMSVFQCSDEASETLHHLREDACEKLSMASIGFDVSERYLLDEKFRYLVIDSDSGMCHLRHYYLNAQTGERLPSKRGCAITTTDMLEFSASTL